MDLVTRNLVNSFKREQSFSDDVEESTLFEHFANYCVVSKEFYGKFDVEDVHVAGANDLQLDGVAVIVNGSLVNEVDEVDDLASLNKYVDAYFVFVQAKSGKGFDGADISNMFYGARDLFSSDPSLPRNEKLSEKERLIKHIYTKSNLFRKGNPEIKLYYVTTGRWQEDEKLKARIETEVTLLEELNIFRSRPDFVPVDARKLQQYFNRTKNALSKLVTFSKRVTLPKMEGLKESHLGYLSILAYLDLITDENGNLLPNIFYDNVRDYLGENNPVNEEIEQTIDSHKKENFILLNNGVTIVADDAHPTGDTFNLTGFQIVNGCQTTHVLFNSRDKLTDDMYISVKLVVAPEGELKNSVIKATNRQTVVKAEDLLALTDFQKFLEEYYKAIPAKHRLFFERRPGQYSSPDIEEIESLRIVTTQVQIQAFASMFLNRAHQASRYYGTLKKEIQNKIFVEGHPPIAYYVSAYALFRINELLKRRKLDSKYRSFRYHLLCIMRMHIAGTSMPSITSNKFEKYSEKIQDSLWNETSFQYTLEKTCQTLDRVLASDYSRDKAKDSEIPAQSISIIDS